MPERTRFYLAMIEKDWLVIRKRKFLYLQLAGTLAVNMLLYIGVLLVLDHLEMDKKGIMNLFSLTAPFLGACLTVSIGFNVLVEERLTRTIQYLFLSPMAEKLFVAKSLSGFTVSTAVSLIWFLLYWMISVGYSLTHSLGIFIPGCAAAVIFLILTPLLNLAISMWMVVTSLRTRDMRVIRQIAGIPLIVCFPLLSGVSGPHLRDAGIVLGLLLMWNYGMLRLGKRWCQYEILL